MRYPVLIWVFISGCIGMNTTRQVTSDVKKNFTNRLEGRPTGLSSKLDINGFYRYSLPNALETSENTGTTFLNILFYEDGSFVRNFSLPSGENNYDVYFASVINKGEKDIFYKNYWWGVYTVSGDTIKTQYLMKAANLTPWYAGEEWYLIKGNNSLQLILYKREISQAVEIARQQNNSYVKTASLAIFHPLINIPPPFAWLKRDKFFWRNENDWAEYMKGVSK